MRGQQHLEAMRHRGQVPRVVMIDADPFPPCRFAQTWPALMPDLAMLQRSPGERATEAAMRCVVGLDVRVGGEDRAAVYAVRDACIKAKASRVIASVYLRESLPNGEVVRFETIETTDSEGVLTWPN